MRVCHVVYSCIPGSFRGGVSKAVWELAKAQAHLGAEVSVFTTTDNSGQPTAIRPDSNIRVEGVQIHYFSSESRRYPRSKLLEKAIRARIGEYDVIHSHNTFLPLNGSAERAARGRVPIVFHVHGALDPLLIRKNVLSRLKKELYLRVIEVPRLNRSSAVVALTDDEARQLRGWSVHAPIAVVPNGVNLPVGLVRSGPAIREELGVAPTAPLVLYVGRLVPKKGIHFLIEAFAAAKIEHRDACLLIGGDFDQDPHYSAKLREMASNLGVDESIRWLGFVDEHQKHRLYTEVALFSHVTESEGMPLAPLEAMAAGVATLVSPGCYMSDAVRAGAVREVPYEPNALGMQLAQLLRSPQARAALVAAGLEYARRNSWEAAAKKLLELYEWGAQPRGHNPLPPTTPLAP